MFFRFIIFQWIICSILGLQFFLLHAMSLSWDGRAQLIELPSVFSLFSHLKKSQHLLMGEIEF